jgi:hypothetical protein
MRLVSAGLSVRTGLRGTYLHGRDMQQQEQGIRSDRDVPVSDKYGAKPLPPVQLGFDRDLPPDSTVCPP